MVHQEEFVQKKNCEDASWNYYKTKPIKLRFDELFQNSSTPNESMIRYEDCSLSLNNLYLYEKNAR